MAKLIYVQSDDERVFSVIMNALKDSGYQPECTVSKDLPGKDRVHTDLAIYCSPAVQPDRLTLGDITLNADTRSAHDAHQNPIHFTPIEFSVLFYLMKNAHRAVSRDELLPAVWGFDNIGGSRVADDTVKRLRRKLNGSSLVIETVWNFGFRLRENN
ncbi:MAG: winged helix-turn-helix transcriptional regulator [Clostridia bacterium]|nr:winged helix-turn-helix transcriptional regulator [Clostridia bacterium]